MASHSLRTFASQELLVAIGNQVGVFLALCISEHTVKAHVTSILSKLHLQTRFQAADYARQWGFYKGG